jgi:hypothetical protein
MFGEGMAMLSLIENPRSGDEDQLVDYVPGQIPNFKNLHHQGSSGSEIEDIPTDRQRASRGRMCSRLRSDNEMDINKSEPETRSSGVDTPYYCLYTGCPRRKRGFSRRHYLTKHLRQVHKLDQKDIREAQGDSQEEMDGGVHVDGFMKELKRRTGWRAVDGKPRRRKKSGGPDKSEGSEEGPEKDVTSKKSSDGLD